MFLQTLVLVVHVFVCIALILIILLQTGKGADIGAAFGGGSSQTVFGSSGAATFLGKVTIGAAVVFMMTSIFLTYFAGRTGSVTEKSIMSDVPMSVPKVEVPQGPPPLPGTQGVTQSEAASPAPQPQSAPIAPSAPAPSTPSGNGAPAPASQ